jgi:hypothetical protein
MYSAVLPHLSWGFPTSANPYRVATTTSDSCQRTGAQSSPLMYDGTRIKLRTGLTHDERSMESDTSEGRKFYADGVILVCSGT